VNPLIAALLRASVHRFIGRLGRDPETRYFESGTCVTNFRIAVNRPGSKRDDGQEPDWFKVEAWGDVGAAIADTAKKGDLIDVSGRVKTSTWTDRSSGEERTEMVISVDTWSPVNPAAPAAKPAAPAPVAVQTAAPEAFDDEEIPF
jgi:single-strand DNA-binding protein